MSRPHAPINRLKPISVSSRWRFSKRHELLIFLSNLSLELLKDPTLSAKKVELLNAGFLYFRKILVNAYMGRTVRSFEVELEVIEKEGEFTFICEYPQVDPRRIKSTKATPSLMRIPPSRMIRTLVKVVNLEEYRKTLKDAVELGRYSPSHFGHLPNLSKEIILNLSRDGAQITAEPLGDKHPKTIRVAAREQLFRNPEYAVIAHLEFYVPAKRADGASTTGKHAVLGERNVARPS